MVLLGSTAGPRLRAFPAVGFAFLMFALRLAKHGCFRCAPVFQGSLAALSAPTACCEMQFWRALGSRLAHRVGGPTALQILGPALSRRHVSAGRPETCWSEQRPRHRHRGPRRAPRSPKRDLRRRPRRFAQEPSSLCRKSLVRAFWRICRLCSQQSAISSGHSPPARARTSTKINVRSGRITPHQS